jgi:murein L,D-transpeptidase YafK
MVEEGEAMSIAKAAVALSVVAVLSGGCLAPQGDGNEQPLPKGITADRIVVEKKARRLTVLCNGRAVKSYRVSLGPVPEGEKTQQGDGRTPEGIYIIDRRKERSSCHRALHVSYPGPGDLAQAKARGVSPGGDIMIHGLRNGLGFLGGLHRYHDWTAGCIAVTNAEIDELWRVVPDGAVVEIRP